MRFIVAFLMLAHGIAHLVGFSVAMGLGKFPELPYKTTLLNGALDVGDAGMRVMGLLWLGLAVAFAAAAAGLVLRQSWWEPVAWWTIGMSILVCALNMPEAKVGLGFNLFLVVALYLAARAGITRGA